MGKIAFLPEFKSVCHSVTMSSRRLKRFSRSPQVSLIKLTTRDRVIISLVARHRFLRSTHIIALAGGSTQQISRRLQLLYHHSYLERPRAQLEYFHRGGSQHIVYGLGSKGAKLLAEEFGDAFGKQKWSEKNRTVGRMFLAHALLVSDVLVAFQLACTTGAVRYIPQYELFPDGIRWSVTLDGGRKLGVLPDAAFALERMKDDGTAERACFFLEADRGTMPVVRKNLAQTSFRRKFLAYAATWSQGLHRTRFDLNRFRMLTVGTSKPRLDALRKECVKLKSGKGLFLFLHKDALAEPASLLTPVWSSPVQNHLVTPFG